MPRATGPVPQEGGNADKAFRLDPSQIKPIARGHGYCYASNRITIEGARVGYMYREEPDDDSDSGWRFFAGDESEDYVDDPDNFAVYDVNTITNYDPSILPLLESSYGVAFERNPRTGAFKGIID